MIRKQAQKAIAVALEILGHTVNTAIMLTGIWCIENLVLYLWGQNKMLLGSMPITYLFDILDIVAIVSFIGYGIYSAIETYRK